MFIRYSNTRYTYIIHMYYIHILVNIFTVRTVATKVLFSHSFLFIIHLEKHLRVYVSFQLILIINLIRKYLKIAHNWGKALTTSRACIWTVVTWAKVMADNSERNKNKDTLFKIKINSHTLLPLLLFSTVIDKSLAQSSYRNWIEFIQKSIQWMSKMSAWAAKQPAPAAQQWRPLWSLVNMCIYIYTSPIICLCSLGLLYGIRNQSKLCTSEVGRVR